MISRNIQNKGMDQNKHELTVSLAQINPTVGDLEGTTGLILDAVKKSAENKADLVVFPQLALTGYPPCDLLKNGEYLAKLESFIDKITQELQGITAVIGCPFKIKDSLVHGALVLSKGKKTVKLVKRSYETFPYFDENSYFTNVAYKDLSKDGDLLANNTLTINGVKVSFSFENEVFTNPFSGEENLHINMSSHPYTNLWQNNIGKLINVAKENNTPVLLVNMAGGQDELVLQGGSLAISSTGQVIDHLKLFNSDILSVKADSNNQITTLRVEDKNQNPNETVFADQDECRISEYHSALITAIHDYMAKNGFKDVVLGISGGVDSALCAALAVKALGSEHVHGVFMPTVYSAGISHDDSVTLCNNLKIDLDIKSIEPVRSAFTELFKDNFANLPVDITEENLQARIRANILMAFSNKFGWLVLCTGNKSETACGYSTLYGDGAGGLAPLKDLYKCDVYALCRYINKYSKMAPEPLIPERILTRPPSAELRPDQKDSDSLPDYDTLDAVLKAYLEDGLTFEEIIKKGFSTDVVAKAIRLTERSEYKRRQGPIGIKLTPMLFGLDRHMPITKKYIY